MSTKSNCHKINSTDEILVSTDLIQDSFRRDFSRNVTRPLCESMPLPGSKSPRLEGAMTLRHGANLQFISVTFNAQRYSRDRRIISGSGPDQYLIAVVGAGAMPADFAGTGVTARSGDICVLDVAQILQCDVTAGSMFSTLIPRRTLAKATGHANLHGLILKAHWPMTKLLGAYLRGLSDVADQFSGVEAAPVQEALVTILAAALKGDRPEDAADLRPLSAALRQRVLDFIDSNFNNHDLGPDFILRRFHVSRAHLYRAFAEDGGISRVIRDRRLDAAFVDLKRPDFTARSIADIAFSLGFADLTHFSRRFRARFDRTPSEVRREGGSGHPASELHAHFPEFRTRASRLMNQ